MRWWLWVLLLQDPAQLPPRVSQDVVVSASTQPVPLDLLARAVFVLTREEIALLPATSVADLLRLSAAVEARSRGAFGTQTDFAVRGGGFGQVVVMVDGVRLNDSQSGHHNGDIPVAIDRIQRIEIVRGTGSSLHGADAVTGTINIITGPPATHATVAGGEYGLIRGAAATAIRRGRTSTTFDGWMTRSAGFMPDRDLLTGGVGVSTALTPHRRLAVSHLRSAFGANGFYGPSPSKEWTDQTLVAFGDRLGGAGRHLTTRASYRTHGDHFLWDIARPGFAENRHRTHAAAAAASFRTGADRNWTSVGVEGGVDWIRSNNLGDHRVQHVAALFEMQRALGRRTTIYPGLRYDAYSVFGDSWSPSVAAVVALSRSLRARGSAGHGFRVPTFTERFYRDPAHLARASLVPERAWGFDGGVDWMHGGWALGLTPFARRETDVIDWVRATPQELWRTANIRRVETNGMEASTSRSWRGGFVRVEYSWTDAAAPALDTLSKYVADYARHSATVATGSQLGRSTSVGLRADCKWKADGRSYCGADLRATRRVGAFQLLLDVTNLFDVAYQEVIGVDMPPRTVAAGVRIGK
jgi:iron complex outermembrane receptor protein